MTDKPYVQMDWTLWCPHHLEPLRRDWPAGSALAMMGLFTAAVMDKRIAEICGADFETGKTGDAKLIDSTMRIIKPVCCYLNKTNPGTAERIVGAAVLGELWPVMPK